jgi:preprotein translocase subunit YajC
VFTSALLVSMLFLLISLIFVVFFVAKERGQKKAKEKSQ